MNAAMVNDDAWEWMVRVYASRSDSLLHAQDTQGLDVVLHLFSLYAAEVLGIVLDTGALAEADALVRPWREEVVQPLRSLRRALKHKHGDAGVEAVEAVRTHVKRAELEAERQQLDALCAWLDRRRAAGAGGLTA